MNTAPEPARKGRKYDDVLRGAREVFLTNGFEGTSVDDIARAAGVSKATLYSYFSDKRLLFLEVARSECTRNMTEARNSICAGMKLEEAVRIAAVTTVEFFTTELYLRMYRIAVAESERFPEVGREFYECGPAQGRDSIVEYLTAAEARGEVKIDDKALAADQFIESCRADLFTRMLFGLAGKPTKDQKNRVVEGAVALFLARYGNILAEKP